MRKKRIKLSSIGDFILKHTAVYEDAAHMRGDFNEEFGEIAETKGIFKARVWYWIQIFKSLPIFLKDFIYWRLSMFLNYLKIALRHMKRHKGFSWINIAGLAIGIECFLLFILYVRFELSYDSMHEKKDSIFRLRVQVSDENGITYLDTVASPHPVGPALREQIPEIEYATRLCPFDEVLLVNKNLNYIERVLFADKNLKGVY
jgi:hypothetical protein